MRVDFASPASATTSTSISLRDVRFDVPSRAIESDARIDAAFQSMSATRVSASRLEQAPDARRHALTASLSERARRFARRYRGVALHAPSIILPFIPCSPEVLRVGGWENFLPSTRVIDA
ncbi:hypothetical protein RI054_28g115730 [Pseudoscourfieldia marina]